jgi:hypothetical protein
MHLALLNGDALVYLFYADKVPTAWHGPAGTPRADQHDRLVLAVGLLDAHTGEWIRQSQSSSP